MYKETIGIVGGFGAQATLGFYKRILEAFASESERNYPHIYMDNDFTMPSRTKALLYGDDYSLVVDMISVSMRKMETLGADYIILVCGTAHAFLPDVYSIIPTVKCKVLNIIEILYKRLKKEKISNVLIIAAEGALNKGLYQSILDGICCVIPTEDDYSQIRRFIEAVKRDEISRETIEQFCDFLDRFSVSNVILGCTEFPLLLEKAKGSEFEDRLSRYRFWDPLDETVRELQERLR